MPDCIELFQLVYSIILLGCKKRTIFQYQGLEDLKSSPGA